MIRNFSKLVILLCLCIVGTNSVQAEQKSVHLTSTKSKPASGNLPYLKKAQALSVSSQSDEDSAIIRITPNKSEIIRLKRDAASVIVGNPTHASVVMDTPRLLVIVPGAPGATSFTVLDGEGNLIMERDVIVSGRNDKFVRVRRMCDSQDSTCMANEVYYCPDTCHEVATQTANSASGGISDIPDIAGGAPINTDDGFYYEEGVE